MLLKFLRGLEVGLLYPAIGSLLRKQKQRTMQCQTYTTIKQMSKRQVHNLRVSPTCLEAGGLEDGRARLIVWRLKAKVAGESLEAKAGLILEADG